MTTKLVRSVAALVIVTVLAIQLNTATGRGINVVNYLSYFTNFSNACAAAVLVCLAVRPSLGVSDRFTIFRGAVTLCMCLTALFYGIFISPGFDGVVRHGLGPIILLADWILHPPPRQTFKPIIQWPILPISYFAYTLVRGSVVGWYPYKFLDPGNAGWPGVISFALAIMLLLLVISFLLLRTTQRPQAQHSF
jgi:hypothetical protein